MIPDVFIVFFTTVNATLEFPETQVAVSPSCPEVYG